MSQLFSVFPLSNDRVSELIECIPEIEPELFSLRTDLPENHCVERFDIRYGEDVSGLNMPG